MSPAAASPSGGVPTRSQIENWDRTHLEDAAARWRVLAAESERLFEQHRQNIAAPGGTEWEGKAKDVALNRVIIDLAVVQRHSNTQRDAADIAANGANDLRAAQRSALDTIAEAEDDGFEVGEDLSVTDTRRRDVYTAGASHRAASEHAEYIRWHAEQLIQTDTLIGDRLSAKGAELESIQFEGAGNGDSDEAIQPVDFNTKSDIPQGIVVLCEPGPRGGPWAFDCHVFYPHGGTEVYPSDDDESGGYP
jgi:hypothetical protein